jgi:hypothetical protein
MVTRHSSQVAQEPSPTVRMSARKVRRARPGRHSRTIVDGWCNFQRGRTFVPDPDGVQGQMEADDPIICKMKTDT